MIKKTLLFLAISANSLNYANVHASINESGYFTNEDSSNNNPPKEISILSWWGYLCGCKDNAVITIEKACNAKLMVDEFHTNSEFVERYNTKPYDIYIYSDTGSGLIERQAENNSVDLSYLTNDYHPGVLKQYKKERRKSNTAYFSISAGVFVYKVDLIEYKDIENLKDLIDSIKDHAIIFPDNAVDVMSLTETAFSDQEKQQYFSKDDPYGFNHLFEGSDIKIANTLLPTGTGKPFAFSYFWSGGTVQFKKRLEKNSTVLLNEEKEGSERTRIIQKGKKGIPDYELDSRSYDYQFHPKYSHITSDLLSLAHNDPTAKCVADQLGHGPAHQSILNRTYYLSPTMIVPKNADELYIEMYNKFIHALASMPWKKELTPKAYQELNTLWQKVRMGL